MAVQTKAAKAAPKAETKEEPEVIVDQRLGKLLKDYTASEKQTGSYWLKIVEYVKENEITRDILKQTLIEFRNIQEATANVEATMILNAAKDEHSDLLDQAMSGDMSVREFRKSIMTKRGDRAPEDNEKKLELKLKQAARFAIEKVEMDSAKEFQKLAFEVFTDVRESYTEDQAEAAEEEDESKEEEGEEEE